jgi:ABC-type phosphate/phosphonate transport system substrate-binding protein
MKLASLPMYDLPELSAATHDLWRGLARHFRAAGVADVPAQLTSRPRLPEHWLSPFLLFSQSCGYPLTHALKGHVRVVATPCYDALGTKGPDYCSVIVVPASAPAHAFADLRGKRAAFNSTESQSGFNVLRALAAPLAKGGRFFSESIETRSHIASLEAVAGGEADLAAIDCVTFALLSRHSRASLAGLRILCRTASAPALPYVTARSTSDDMVERLRRGLQAAMTDPVLADTKAKLLLTGVEVLPESAYDRIVQMEAAALALDYPGLD